MTTKMRKIGAKKNTAGWLLDHLEGRRRTLQAEEAKKARASMATLVSRLGEQRAAAHAAAERVWAFVIEECTSRLVAGIGAEEEEEDDDEDDGRAGDGGGDGVITLNLAHVNSALDLNLFTKTKVASARGPGANAAKAKFETTAAAAAASKTARKRPHPGLAIRTASFTEAEHPSVPSPAAVLFVPEFLALKRDKKKKGASPGDVEVGFDEHAEESDIDVLACVKTLLKVLAWAIALFLSCGLVAFGVYGLYKGHEFHNSGAQCDKPLAEYLVVFSALALAQVLLRCAGGCLTRHRHHRHHAHAGRHAHVHDNLPLASPTSRAFSPHRTGLMGSFFGGEGGDGDGDDDMGGGGPDDGRKNSVLAALGSTFSVPGLSRRHRRRSHRRRHSHGGGHGAAHRRCGGRRCRAHAVTALSALVAAALVAVLVLGCAWVYGTDWDGETAACDAELLDFARWFLYLLWIGVGAIGCYLVLLIIVILAEVKGWL